MGPFIQYAAEKADPVEIRIYPGADGSFTLYEDENDNYNYEKGMFSTISLQWNDAKHLFTIGKRIGTFPGMAKGHEFKVVIVKKNKGQGIEISAAPDKSIQYTGEEKSIQF
jgi:alpha-D-xyloside xylohydrolase